jgi:hypothetical protein
VDKTDPPAPRWAGIGFVVLLVMAYIGLGAAFGFLRAAIAVVMFAALSLFGARQVRSMMRFPPDPEIADVSDYGLKYVCTMCGLELKIEKAAKDKAPTHCMEPMVLVRTGGKPPLTTVD